MRLTASGDEPETPDSGGPLLFLRERFAWMGAHSGYDRVFDEIARQWPDGSTSVHRERSPWKNALFQPLAWLSRPHTAFYNGDSTRAELLSIRRARRSRSALVHVAFVENNLRLLATHRRRGSPRLVGTAHQAERWWRTRHRHPELISRLDGLVVLCRKQQHYFETFLPGGVHWIRHGVDTDFFSPAPRRPEPPEGSGPRCVFGGIWMRDLVTLRHSIDEALTRRPQIGFDMIVPRQGRSHPELERIARHDRVVWHENVSSDRLRAIYRGARMLVLPLLDATANNTLLEAMACGLPVVTTDVGGIADYTLPSFATRLGPGDVEGLVEAMLRLSDDPAEARARGSRARDFAERELRWQPLASQTLALYRRLLSSAAGGSAEPEL